MYRAIPEVNRICAMADRGRSYKLHQQALSRIKNQPATFKKSDSMNNLDPIPSYAGSTTNADGKSNASRSTSLLSKAQKERQLQIYNENQKILKAIEYQSPTICRADFFEHELDHKRQVSRMTGKPEIYGFPVSKDKNTNLNKKNKSKKNKNFDPAIVRPMPKKFDIASFENSESKSSQSKKKPQKGSNKNNGSKSGELDDILSNNTNGLINSLQDSPDAQNKKQQKPKSQTEKKPESQKEDSGAKLNNVITYGANSLSKTPQMEEQDQNKNSNEKKEEAEQKNNDVENVDKDEDEDVDDHDGDLEQVVGGGVNALTGDGN